LGRGGLERKVPSRYKAGAAVAFSSNFPFSPAFYFDLKAPTRETKTMRAEAAAVPLLLAGLLLLVGTVQGIAAPAARAGHGKTGMRAARVRHELLRGLPAAK